MFSIQYQLIARAVKVAVLQSVQRYSYLWALFYIHGPLWGKVWDAGRRPFFHFTYKEVNNVMSEELTYIISLYAGDIEANVKFAIRCCRAAIQQGHTPIAVHLLYPQILDDRNPAERKKGLELGLNILRHCAAAWVCGTRISSGMEGEIQAAQQLNIPIRYMEEIE